MTARPPRTIEHMGHTYRLMRKTGRPPKQSRDVGNGIEWWCPCCEAWKTGDKFSRSKSAKNGLDSWCKECRREDSTMRRAVRDGAELPDDWREGDGNDE